MAPTRTHARTREDGFTIVELLIAMLIIVILVVVAIKAFGGAKGATYANEAKAAGSAYLQAVSQFQADNANRLPAANQWDAQRGPRNLLNQPYMKTAPEGVLAGRIGVSNTCPGGNPPGSFVGYVNVCMQAAPRYYVRVASRKSPSATTWAFCFLGSAPAGSPAC